MWLWGTIEVRKSNPIGAQGALLWSQVTPFGFLEGWYWTVVVEKRGSLRNNRMFHHFVCLAMEDELSSWLQQDGAPAHNLRKPVTWHVFDLKSRVTKFGGTSLRFSSYIEDRFPSISPSLQALKENTCQNMQHNHKRAELKWWKGII